MNKIIDVHSHFLSSTTVIEELVSIVASIISNKYPLKGSNNRNFTMLDNDLCIESIIIAFFELVRIGIGSENMQRRHLRRKLKAYFDTDEVIICPLMVDFFYIFAMPLTSNEYDDFMKISCSKKDYNMALIKIKEYIDIEIFNESEILENSLGFNRQIEVLKKMANRYNYIKPFLGIDPRRKNFMEIIKKNIWPNGKFIGIKIYPRFGFNPICDPMLELYDYCIKFDIPITMHCAEDGFPPSKWGYKEFCNPKLFSDLISDKNYRKLKLNFAHFGAFSDEWRVEILKMMELDENRIYADVSCYNSEDDLAEVRDIMRENDILKNRLMFGTDYIFNILASPFKMTLSKYLNSYNCFSNDEIDKIASLNSSEFLKRK